ncbi:MAG TPA: N-6 DNA methylase [Halothiobacillus sp.]|nr:N-6 DNA methylase [Halothiobacillus sp.]
MLDTDTKRRIDSCRDILVGKVPDPKSQVEQITIALIYKFMDDMDAEAEEMGGKRSFFAGDYAKYGWSKLMAPGMGGFDVLALYSEAIQKMNENPGIPALFRDIFKNAYLPYRDPETLRAFLKEIDSFTYDHSERLGDAFEYLLSVLGSQGDAGQFRTPRHIIDFMVEIIDPKKSETLLDPACGTAGFLISAWKHILKSNTKERQGDQLTPDERKQLAANIHGYDISPDMVRLSLVNMYLHGFTDPHIDEYDTLTSEERWHHSADIILANPPFMSPKGGIKPHKRFSVQATRSEVLFVDYIAEHLTPTGRAAVIVPEGIIFQSQTAYKALRKLLVENYLVAVVSLPAGVFQPYSGVKTSILILDKALARKAESIGFFKVENDGFGLGAQRRAIDKNDLPQVHAEISEYQRRLRAGGSVAEFQPTLGLVVDKAKVAANDDYNLSGERYREGSVSLSEYPHVRLSEVCDINPDPVNPGELYPNSDFNYIDISCVENGSGKFLGANKTTSELAPSRARRSVRQGDVLMSTVRPNLKAFALLTEVPHRAVASTGFAVLRAKPDRLVPGFLINVLRDDRSVNQMIGMAGKGAYPSINQTDVESIKIPLPPLDMQKEIVAEIEGYQKVIDGARAVLDNYRPHIPIHPEWPMVSLASVCETITDGDHQPPPKASEGVPFVTITNINDQHELDFTRTFFVPESYYSNLNAARKPRGGDVLYTVTGSYGIPVLVPENIRFCFQRHIALIRTGPQLLNRFLLSLLASPFMLQQGHEAATGVAQKTVSLSSLRSFQIPLPPLATQQAIIAEIEAEQALVNANRELITRFEKKIQATLAHIWGEEETAPAES